MRCGNRRHHLTCQARVDTHGAAANDGELEPAPVDDAEDVEEALYSVWRRHGRARQMRRNAS
jgi:hypothetical protein